MRSTPSSGVVDRQGDLVGQVVEVRPADGLVHGADRLRADGSGPAARSSPACCVSTSIRSVKGVLQKARVVAHVLGRRVDLVGDSGGQLADAAQLLRLGELIFQILTLRDIGADNGEPPKHVSVPGQRLNRQPQQPVLAVRAHERHVVDPDRNTFLTTRADASAHPVPVPANPGILEAFAAGLRGCAAEDLSGHPVPARDPQVLGQPDQNGRQRVQQLLGLPQGELRARHPCVRHRRLFGFRHRVRHHGHGASFGRPQRCTSTQIPMSRNCLSAASRSTSESRRLTATMACSTSSLTPAFLSSMMSAAVVKRTDRRSLP